MMESWVLKTGLGVTLLAAAVCDFRSGRIPNTISLTAALAAIVLHSWMNGVHGLLVGTGGLLTGMGLLMLPYLAGGMGAGDVKLMGAVGAFLGVRGVFNAFLVTAVCGGLCAIALVLFRPRHFRGFFLRQMTALQILVTTGTYPCDPGARDRPKLRYGMVIALGTVIHVVSDMTGLGFSI